MNEPFDLSVQASLFLSPVGEFSFVIASAGLAVGVVRALWPDIASVAGVVVMPRDSGEVA